MSKEEMLIDIINDLLGVMEIQEKREQELFHISQSAMKNIWDKAKENAKGAINNA